MKLIFMGSPDFAVASLNALLHSEHKVELVVTQPDKPANRGQKLTPCAVAEFASSENLKVVKPEKVKGNEELVSQFKKIAPDAIIVVAYGKIIPNDILSIPKLGCINVHSSLLPKYRGAAPINAAIINGDKYTGVTTMFINEKMDEGDILLQCQTEIMSHDTAEMLHDHLAVTGAELLVKTLDRIEKEGLKGVPQDHSKATYTKKLSKEDGLIDWSLSAASIYNKIRGLMPWPVAFVRLSKEEGDVLKIFDAAPIEVDSKEKPGTIISVDKGILVQTGFGQLFLLEVQAPGKKRMPAADFLKGHKMKVGDRL